MVEKDFHISEKYNFRHALSHGLQIPDAIIAATSIVYQIPLYTYNLKDFNFIPELALYSNK